MANISQIQTPTASAKKPKRPIQVSSTATKKQSRQEKPTPSFKGLAGNWSVDESDNPNENVNSQNMGAGLCCENAAFSEADSFQRAFSQNTVSMSSQVARRL
jgi:hypothetical protein